MQAITILHIADIHLGGSGPAFGDRVEDHHALLEEAFGDCIDLAIERGVNAVCIVGDLFYAPRPSERTLQAALGALRRLSEEADPAIPCFLLPGNHDCLQPEGIYQRPEFDREHLYVYREAAAFSAEGLPATFHGNPQSCDRSRHQALSELESNPASQYNIALAHGAVAIPGITADDELAIPPEEIADCGMDYVALGHWHDPGDYSQNGVIARYSGATEIVGIDDKQPGNALLVTLSEAGVNVEMQRTGRLRTDSKTIDPEMYPNEGAVCERIAEFADEQLLFDVTIEGLAPKGFVCDEEAVIRELQDSFFRLEVCDKSAVPEEASASGRAADRMIATKAEQILRERIQQASDDDDEDGERIARRALQLTRALFAGKRVLE